MALSIINYLRIAILISLGTYASFTDIKNGIIKNRVLLGSVAVSWLLIIMEWFFSHSINVVQLANIAIISFLAILLYVTHVWAGGDSKLAIVFASLMPTWTAPTLSTSELKTIVYIAIAFALSFLFLLLDSIYRFLKKQIFWDSKHFKETTIHVLYNWLSCIAYIFLINQLLHLLLPSTNVPIFIIIPLNISVILLISGLSMFKKQYLVIAILIADVVLVIIKRGVFSSHIFTTYFLALIMIILRVFIDEFNYEPIHLDELTPGMVLSMPTTVQFMNSRIHGLPELSKEDLRSRLSAEEVESVKRWASKQKQVPTFVIVRKIPFAIFLSLGAIIYAVTGAFI